jgi:hypothetical protein
VEAFEELTWVSIMFFVFGPSVGIHARCCFHKINVLNCDFRIMALILMMWKGPVNHSDACVEVDIAVIRTIQVCCHFSVLKRSIFFGSKRGILYL